MIKQKWVFSLIWGWDLRHNFIDINFLSFHKEPEIIWFEIFGLIFIWEQEYVIKKLY